MKITKEHMRKYVQDNPDLVSVKKQAPGITVLKYKPKVFYKNLWTPELCELRGTVVDDDFNIIQRPFTKIFNYGEKCAPKINRDSPVFAPEKINGFMAAASIYNGKLFISTTGSTTSDFVDLARKHLEKLHWDTTVLQDLTYIYEICDESDPHIIPEKIGAHLIGARKKEWNTRQHELTESTLDSIAEYQGCLRPSYYYFDTFQECKDTVKTVTHEGFVIWENHGNELKIKSPYYLVTKFFGRKTQEKLEKLLDHPEEIKKIIDEEYYPVIDYISENKDLYNTMNEQEKMAFVRYYIETEIFK